MYRALLITCRKRMNSHKLRICALLLVNNDHNLLIHSLVLVNSWPHWLVPAGIALCVPALPTSCSAANMYLQASVFSLPSTRKANDFFIPTLESAWTILSPYSWMSKARRVSCTQKLQPVFLYIHYSLCCTFLETLESVTSCHITWAAR